MESWLTGHLTRRRGCGGRRGEFISLGFLRAFLRVSASPRPFSCGACADSVSRLQSIEAGGLVLPGLREQ